MSRATICIEPPSIWRLHPAAELARLTHFADLLWTLSLHRVNVRYKQSRLGIVWALLQPVSMMIVFTLMFSFVGGAPQHGIPYPVFAYAALLPWTMFSGGLVSAAGALTSHAALLTKVYFPREILPLTYVVAALVDFAIASGALALLMWWYQIPLTPLALWGLVAIALLAGFLVGGGLLLGALQVRYRDVGHALPVFLQIWMFASPVLYPLDAVRHALSPGLYAFYLVNPMAGIIDTFRRTVVLQQPPDLMALGMSAAVIATLLPLAYVYFKYSELTMADVV